MIHISKNKYTNDLSKYFKINLDNKELNNPKYIFDDILNVVDTILVIKNRANIDEFRRRNENTKHIEENHDLVFLNNINEYKNKPFSIQYNGLIDSEVGINIFLYKIGNEDDLDGFIDNLIEGLDYEIYTTLKRSKLDIIIEKLDEIRNLLNKNGV